MSCSKKLFFLFLTSVCFSSLFGETVDFSGYIKNYFSLSEFAPEKSSRGMNTNAAYLKIRFIPNGHLSFNASYKLSMSASDPYFADYFMSDDLSYRVTDFKSSIYPPENEKVKAFFINHNIDRLYVSLKTKKFDVYAGRQAISWGMSRFVSPTDVLAKTSFFDVDREEFRGADAVLARFPCGTGELTAGSVFGSNFSGKNSVHYIKTRIALRGFDTEILAAQAKEDFLAGFSFSCPFKGALIWFENACHFSLKGFNSSAGFDYYFPGGLYIFFEYYFNSFGENSAENYHLNSVKTAYEKNFIYLQAKNYLSFGFNRQINPLVSMSMKSSLNVCDVSLFVLFSSEMNLRENVYIEVGYATGVSLNSASRISEYGNYGKMAFASSVFYF